VKSRFANAASAVEILSQPHWGIFAGADQTGESEARLIYGVSESGIATLAFLCEAACLRKP
jgi:hypothetical protein